MELYKKDGEYDLPLLYSLYHQLDDKFECDSVRRLIKTSIPDKISDCYVVQSKYELCKKELFTGDYMNYGCISDAFPELSLMLLKHKQFINSSSMDMKELCSPLLVDAFIGSLRKIDDESLKDMFKFADPKTWTCV